MLQALGFQHALWAMAAVLGLPAVRVQEVCAEVQATFGPGSQEVQNTWNSANDYWYYMLAQEGYIVACVDGRGTVFKGAAFKKVTYK